MITYNFLTNSLTIKKKKVRIQIFKSLWIFLGQNLLFYSK